MIKSSIFFIFLTSCINTEKLLDQSVVIDCELLKPLRYENATSEVLSFCFQKFFFQQKKVDYQTHLKNQLSLIEKELIH